MRKLLELFHSNWISTLGVWITTLAFLGLASGYALNSVGTWTGPYVGLVFVALLTMFIGGLVVIPVGLLIYRRTLSERLATTRVPTRRVAYSLVGLTLLNFVVIGSAGTSGASAMGTVEFCGTACHQVMHPEYDTYFDSPHSDVACIECHVGPGAGWFLKSKLNGAHQAWLTLTGGWEAPIPTPVDKMRPAHETCGQCHSTREAPDRLVVAHHFDDDAEPATDVLMVHVGGKPAGGESHGIHRHADPDLQIRYVHTDEDRMEIPWVQVTDAEGNVRTYTVEDVDPASPPEGTERVMDCTDCHNRAAHRFHGLDESIDRMLLAGELDPDVPEIVPAARTALEGQHARDDARASLRASLDGFYAERDEAPDDAALAEAAAALEAAWLRNVYPGRGVTWGTYQDLNGHAGCLRCHDGEHMDASGEAITMDCDACHSVVAMQETEPEVLDLLGIEPPR